MPLKKLHYTEKIKAFTLVELLVVIAIISVLAGMLLPALEDAISTSRSIACMNRQKQFGLMIEYYRNDSRGYFPVRGHMGMDFLTQIGPYADPGQSDYTSANGMWHPSNDAGSNTFLCPGHYFVPGSTSNQIYGRDAPYEGNPMAHISNWRVFNYAIGTQFGYTHVWIKPGLRRNISGDASKIAMLTDQGGSGAGYWVRGAHEIHVHALYPHPGESANYLFADGHVENVGDRYTVEFKRDDGDILIKPTGGW